MSALCRVAYWLLPLALVVFVAISLHSLGDITIGFEQPR